MNKRTWILAAWCALGAFAARERLRPRRGLQLGRRAHAHLARLPDPDASGTGDHRACHEEGDQLAGQPVEGDRPRDEVVLVRAVRGTLPVHVVLVEPHLQPLLGQVVHRGPRHQLAGAVPPHRVQR